MKVSIDVMQEYLLERYGSWATEQGLFLKLAEELGEVAEVLNIRSGNKRKEISNTKMLLGTELADMLHYIVAIAAINDIDLNTIILEKDKKASLKYHHNTNLEKFILNKEL